MEAFSKPLVQVICLTYNHKNFIEQALNGFIIQKTHFPFEVLIADDASTDGTSDIISKYCQEYPHILKHIKREHNLGVMKNAQDIRNRITAKYICYCEGDDYWTDPLKLQKQVDFLENHTDYKGCFHDAEIVKKSSSYWYLDKDFAYEQDGKRYFPRSKKNFIRKTDFTLIDLIGVYIIHTATIMFRWDYGIKIPDWINNCRGGDFVIQMLQLGTTGKYYYMQCSMSVYRVANGISSYQNNDELIKKSKIATLKTYVNLKEYFYPFGIEKFELVLNNNFNQLFSFILRTCDLELQQSFVNNFPHKYLSLIKKHYINSNQINYSLYFLKAKFLTIKKSKTSVKIYLFNIIPLFSLKKRN